MNESRREPVVLHVRPEEGGQRLDLFVATRLSDSSRAKVQRAISAGGVHLNGRTAAKRATVQKGDVIVVDLESLPSSAPVQAQPQDIPIDILFEDEYLLAVNKPAGLVVHPGNGNPDGTLVNALAYHIDCLSEGYRPERPGIVHRLDKDTSGVILVAKKDKVHAALGELFARREVHKEYVGMCVGRRPQEHGTIGAPIGRSRRDPLLRSVRGDGKDALTEYVLLKYLSGVSLVRFRLHTGRTHQIRVHSRHLGFPIVADEYYGGGREAVKRLEPMERPTAYAVFRCFGRQALHAMRVRLVHPQTGKELCVEAPLPEDFREAVAVLDYRGEI